MATPTAARQVARTPRRWRMAVLGAALGAAAGPSACTPADSVCGEGTVETPGFCIVVAEPGPTCGQGTIFDVDLGACVPVLACGEGSALDAALGACVPLIECGLGTVLNLTTGECTATVSCGAGTVLVDGECATAAVCGPGTVLNPHSDEPGATPSCDPVDPCTHGTTYNAETGRCESQLACAEHHVEVGGVCYPEGRGLAAQAGAWEAAVDHNDPVYGGNPEPLPPVPEGAPLVFLGNIGRPTDLDGNGTFDQDRDVWQLQGDEGQVLRIRVLSAGLPQPAFILEGPGGYRRESAMGWVVEADRRVVLPRPGTYRITVLPAAFATAGLALGGTLADYIGVVEVEPLPSAWTALPGAPGEAIIEGDLLDMSANAGRLAAAARTAAVVRFTSLAPDARPAVVTLDGSGRLISDVVVDRARGDWAATFVSLADDTRVIIDWVASRGPQNDFVAELLRVPLVECGSYDEGSAVATPRIDVPADGFAAFAYTLTGDQVLRFTVHADAGFAEPDLQLLGPDGTDAVVWDDDQIFAYARPGDYVAVLHNDEGTPATNVFLGGALPSTANLGTLDPVVSPALTVRGDSLTESFGGVESSWAVVATPPEAWLTMTVTAEAGEPELAIYRQGGAQVRRVARPQLDRRIHVHNPTGEQLIFDMHPMVDLASKARAVAGWTLTLQAVAARTLIDVEPNDDQLQAVDLPPLPAAGFGTLTESTTAFNFRDRDVYSFTLAQELGPGQGVAIWLDNLDADPGIFDAGDISLRVYDALYLPVDSIPGQVGPVTGTVAPTSVTYLSGAEGQGPFYVELTEWKVEGTSRYLLEIEVVDVPVEVEPNEVRISATPLGTPAVHAAGYWDSGVDTADLYAVELAAPLLREESLVVRFANLETTTSMALVVEDLGGTTLLSTQGAWSSLQLADLAAGTYTVRVTGNAAGAPGYSLDVGIGPPCEHEPNDSDGAVHELGDLPQGGHLTVDGRATSASIDLFAFGLPSPWAAGDSVLVQAWNLSDTSNVRVDLYPGSDTNPSNVIAFDAGPMARAVVTIGAATRFTVRVTGSGDRYRLWVSKGPAAEAEPNGTPVTATPIALPGTLYGLVDSADVDFYAVDLPGSLGPTQRLRAALRNAVDASPIALELLAGDGATTLAAGSGSTALAGVTGPAAGTYYLRVSEPTGSAIETDYYELHVAVIVVQDP